VNQLSESFIYLYKYKYRYSLPDNNCRTVHTVVVKTFRAARDTVCRLSTTGSLPLELEKKGTSFPIDRNRLTSHVVIPAKLAEKQWI
jgi:hypothetical protein